jgi:hypothetical protein
LINQKFKATPGVDKKEARRGRQRRRLGPPEGIERLEAFVLQSISSPFGRQMKGLLQNMNIDYPSLKNT